MQLNLIADRIKLIPIDVKYAKDICSHFTAEITRYMWPSAPKSQTEIDQHVLLRRNEMQAGENISLLVIKKDTEEFLGYVTLDQAKSVTPELGLWLKKDAHGFGYGFEALNLLKTWAEKNLQYNCLKYPVDKQNIPSRKLAEKLGGRIEAEYIKKSESGNLLDEVEYRIYRKSSQKNKLVVISGCSSGGKSTVLTELSNNGYTVMPEVGRELVKEQLALHSDILPWKEPIRFCELLIEKSIDRYHEATKFKSAVKDNVIFFDRSFLEGVSYFQTLKINKYDYLINELRYYATIFMAPPWKEIFCEDDERKNTFENAVEEYERSLKCYVEYGYYLIELPKTSVKKRFQFIISTLNNEALNSGESQ